MRLLLLIFVFHISSFVFGQKPEPTKSETFEWLLSKFNKCNSFIIEDYNFYKRDIQSIKISFNETDCDFIFEKWYYISYSIHDSTVIHLKNLNNTSISWELKDEYFIFKISAVNNTTSSDNFHFLYKDSENMYILNSVINDIPFVKIYFKLNELQDPDDPGLKDRITKAIKHLIKLCGGYAQSEKF